ncbi:hypothetical protein [Novosphingobium sp.]|uniref:hypothetical protein n=1 Tax=Novosphingobium sp. TaxID=1874826 RepID=UPI003341D67B
MNGRRNPDAFGARGTFVLIAAGFVAFVVLLVWLGTGDRPANNGGAHGLGKGITGYAALAAMLQADGHSVGFNRAPHHAGGGDLLVLTPLPGAEAKDIAALVQARRSGLGPTIVVTPKWRTELLGTDPRARPSPWTSVFGAPRAPTGWTTIVGAGMPDWKGFLDRVGVTLGNSRNAAAHGWRAGDGTHGPLPDDHVVLAGNGFDDAGHPLVPLVRSGDGRILAGYFADGGNYPALDALAGAEPTDDAAAPLAATMQPLVMVFEPDLLNNRGLADRATALNARALIVATAGGERAARLPIVFDLSLAGLGAPRNLLTLAFEPPFLAATICLLLAMAAVGWRAFARFGPARHGAPADTVGKLALVDGGAALLLRARRHHLITGPYADATRERLQIALGLPRWRNAAETDAAIERIQHLTAPGTTPFATAVARLTAARTPPAIAARAADLHTIETLLVHSSRHTPT